MKIDKEIIYDGIDVSECEEVFSSLLPIGNTKIKCRIYQPSLCKESPNCYFKQLKRAEQKLEKVKEYLNSCNLKADFTACDILQIVEGEENA